MWTAAMKRELGLAVSARAPKEDPVGAKQVILFPMASRSAFGDELGVVPGVS